MTDVFTAAEPCGGIIFTQKTKMYKKIFQNLLKYVAKVKRIV